ncbi:hypothetical protein [Streptomyces axinellae]|uniref:Lipoprotein n=1 Tax=Streptomyces axinellae TaxID=552788 RepID=A0ABP6C1Z3_9ACTN
MPRTTRRVGAAALAAVAFAAVTGCSQQGRQYAVPKKICDVRVSEDALEPLLPDGEKLNQSQRPIGESQTACVVNVADGPYALNIDIIELDKPLTADDKRVSLKSLKHAKSVRVPDAHWAVQGDNHFHLSTSCGTDWADSLAFRFTFGKGEKGVEASRGNALRFVKEFVRGEKEEEGCTAR